MSTAELVFIPSPIPSHLVSTIEAVKLLLARDHRLSVTVLIAEEPSPPSHPPTPRLTLIHLPNQGDPPGGSKIFYLDYADSQTDNIRRILSDIRNPSGLVLGMFCTNLTKVADEFGLPSYVFYTSGACSLSLFYELIALRTSSNQDLARYKNSDAELAIRCFSQPLPAKLLPGVLLNADGAIENMILDSFKRMFETKGIMVNTFYELDSYALQSLMSDHNSPKIYPVGPVLNPNKEEPGSRLVEDAMEWLDEQAENSVVFLCFGTMGSFDKVQVREIAKALEDSGSQFLWSLRKPGPPKGMMPLPVEYDSFDEVLPEGFLDRTREVGRVVGWAPQVAALGHAAVGAFVSHCGWNSTLESVWFGVPMAAWPLYAEQQTNAFQLVRELGIAEAVRMDYQMDIMGEEPPEVVPAGEIESAIRRVMAAEGVRGKVRELQRKSREALKEGGSSYAAQVQFVEDVLAGIGSRGVMN